VFFFFLNSPALEKDKAFGFSTSVGRVTAITCGYFLYDLIESSIYFKSLGFVIHGGACLAVFSQAFRPFLGYYGPRFLLWELSTPFLTIHWFLDKTKRTGSTLQWFNGMALLATFFGARICYGGYMSYNFFQTLQAVRSQLPTYIVVVYALGNLSLQSLNWFWFYKMLQSVSKRFSEKEKPSGERKME